MLCDKCKHAINCPAKSEHGGAIRCSAFKPQEMTNEEWLRSASTEELVQAIHLMTTCCYVCGKEGVDYKRCYFHKKCTGPKEIEEWLKEPHDSFE